MHVLVTGAHGFVGSYLCPRLEQVNITVTGIDSEIEITDAAALSHVIEKCNPDAVVHLAAQSSVAQSYKDSERIFRVNVEGTRTLLDTLSTRAPKARIILVSSGSVYGDCTDREPFSEDDPMDPNSPYAKSKVCAETIGREYIQNGLDVFCVRPFNHTGPGRHETFVESSFAKQLVEIELRERPPLIKVGNLKAVRDFLDVEDVIAAYISLLKYKGAFRVFNVASGKGTEIRTLLNLLIKCTRGTDSVKVEEAPSLIRPTDTSVGSPLRIQKETSWNPRHNLTGTLERLVNYWREQLTK